MVALVLGPGKKNGFGKVPCVIESFISDKKEEFVDDVEFCRKENVLRTIVRAVRKRYIQRRNNNIDLNTYI